MPGELKATGFLIDLEDGDIVGSLIARVEKIPGRIKIKTAGIIPPRPFVRNKGQLASCSD